MKKLRDWARFLSKVLLFKEKLALPEALPIFNLNCGWPYGVRVIVSA